jgi:hypothetical protein
MSLPQINPTPKNRPATASTAGPQAPNAIRDAPLTDDVLDAAARVALFALDEDECEDELAASRVGGERWEAEDVEFDADEETAGLEVALALTAAAPLDLSDGQLIGHPVGWGTQTRRLVRCSLRNTRWMSPTRLRNTFISSGEKPTERRKLTRTDPIRPTTTRRRGISITPIVCRTTRRRLRRHGRRRARPRRVRTRHRRETRTIRPARDLDILDVPHLAIRICDLEDHVGSDGGVDSP